MVHLPDLIHDLGVILITAAVVTLLFKKLQQPVVLGYLIAGILVGPHVSFMPTVVEAEGLKVWAEIGVIFLLFGLGLEFSFKKLAAVGISASVTALFEILFMIFVGYLAGRFLGWRNMDSLFLGGILSISSTTIIARAFDELGLKGKKFVSLVFGVLIVEDLMAILLMVTLSTLAVSRAFSGFELLFSTVKLMFFMILWFVLGIYTLPIILKKAKNLLNDETMLIVSIGLCLSMVTIATETGFSPALGAFVMGSLLAETREGKSIEHLITPVKNLFAAIFFVSVGMMIDPMVLKEYFGVIMFLTAITIIGKIISSTLGALLSGQSLKISVQTGMSLAQIGEFSFIIATLGVTLKVTSDHIYPIAVAVSCLTTFATPYLIKYSTPLYYFIERLLPQEFKDKLLKYQTDIASGPAPNIVSVLWGTYLKRIILNGVIIFTIIIASKKYLLPLMVENFGDSYWLKMGMASLVVFMASPFIWALAVSKMAPPESQDIFVLKTMRLLDMVVSALRLFLGVLTISYIVGHFISLQAASLFIFIGIASVAIFLIQFSENYYLKIEQRFLSHLGDREKHYLEKEKKVPKMAPWNATLAEYVVNPGSKFVARSLVDIALKERFGVLVALIERGKNKIIAPRRTELLLPYDRLFLIGTDEQLDIVRQLVEGEKVQDSSSGGVEVYGLGSLLLTSDSEFLGRTIRDCGVREKVQGIIVGLERENERLLNPDSAIELSQGDLLWIVGDKSKIKGLA